MVIAIGQYLSISLWLPVAQMLDAFDANAVLEIAVPWRIWRDANFDVITSCSGTADVNNQMYKFTADVARLCSRAHFYILFSCMSFLAHLLLILRNGDKVVSVMPCFTANQILSAFWYPLRLSHLIPFYTRRMGLATNNIAYVHCGQTKGIISSL